MSRIKRETVMRIMLALAILLAGVALVPFIDQPAEAIGWELFAGVYAPTLAVNETSGAPGSVFAFVGSDYPPDSVATIYVNGSPVGTLLTDPAGAASFALNTLGASPDQYNVTMEVDINASATQSIELVENGPIVSPPPGFSGEVFFINHAIFQPIIQKS